jgi:serine/threonine-protein kinase RsbW
MLFELKIDLQTHIGEQAQYDDITLISFRRKTAGERDHHAICRPATMERFEEMRDFVEAAAGLYGLDEEAIFAFKLTAEEVLTNIIQYGYRDRLPGLIALAFECAGGRATLKIWDDGFHFPPETAAAPDVGLALEDREIGGLGIFFVRELMDAVSYKIDENLMNLLVVSKTIAA